MSDSKPSDQRRMQREQDKHDGRNRRAELILTKQEQSKARQEVLEGRQAELEKTVAALGQRAEQAKVQHEALAARQTDLEQALAELARRVAALEAAGKSS